MTNVSRVVVFSHNGKQYKAQGRICQFDCGPENVVEIFDETGEHIATLSECMTTEAIIALWQHFDTEGNNND